MPTEPDDVRFCCLTPLDGEHTPMPQAEAEARHAGFQQAIAESSQRIAEAANWDRMMGRMNPGLGVDREPVRLRDALKPLEQLQRARGLLADPDVLDAVLKDVRRQIGEAQANDRAAGNRDRERFWRDMNPGLAALLGVLES